MKHVSVIIGGLINSTDKVRFLLANSGEIQCLPNVNIESGLSEKLKPINKFLLKGFNDKEASVKIRAKYSFCIKRLLELNNSYNNMD